MITSVTSNFPAITLDSKNECEVVYKLVSRKWPNRMRGRYLLLSEAVEVGFALLFKLKNRSGVKRHNAA